MRATAFVGRVGGLAVALGIGVGLGGGGGLACASPADSSASEGTESSVGRSGAEGSAPRARERRGVRAVDAKASGRGRSGSSGIPRAALAAPSATVRTAPQERPADVPGKLPAIGMRPLAATSVAAQGTAVSAPPVVATAGAVPVTPVIAAPVRAVAASGVVESVLSPLSGSDPLAPVGSVVSFAALAAVRRELVRPSATVPGAATVTTGQSLNPIPSAAVKPAATAATPLVYLTDYPSRSVIVIDGATNSKLTTITQGIGNGPAGLAVNPAGTLALIPNMNDGTVSVLDTAKGQVSKTLTVGKTPVHAVFSPDGTRAYVVNLGDLPINGGMPGNGFVSVIDTSSIANPTVLATTYKVGAGAGDVAVAGTKLFVVNSVSNSLSVIDTKDGSVASVGTGLVPGSVALNSAATLAYVTNQGDNSISVIDIASKKLSSTIPLFRRPAGIAVSPDGQIVVTNPEDYSVTVVNGSISTPITVSGSPGQVVINSSAAGDFAYVTHGPGSSTGAGVAVIDIKKGSATRFKVVKDIIVGTAPAGLTIWAGGSAPPPATAPVVSVSPATQSVDEGSAAKPGRAAFTVALADGATAGPDGVRVDWAFFGAGAQFPATEGADFIQPSVRSVRIAPNANSAQFFVDFVGDSVAEADEKFFLTLLGSTTGASLGATGRSATVTIRNDDQPTLKIADASVEEGQSGTRKLTFEVSLSAPPTAGDVKVNWATKDSTGSGGATVADKDYVAGSGQLTFAKDATALTQKVEVTVNGDTKVEPAETLTVTLSNPSGATLDRATATGTIRDDDGAKPPVVVPTSVAIAPTAPGRTRFEVRNNSAFAALRGNGTVRVWGDKTRGGDPAALPRELSDPSKPVTQIYSTSGAFAALRSDGSVVTWGDKGYGGDSTLVAAKLSDPKIKVVQIYSSERAFAALRADGSVVTWGDALYGGDSSKVATQLNGVDGPVGAIGDPAPDSRDIAQIVSTASAFAALTKGGAVVTWGRDGGDSSKVAALLTDPKNPVTAISSTQGAFAALRSNGSVITWGPTGLFDSNKKPIDYGANSSAVAGQLNGSQRVIQVFSNGSAFAALREGGSVITWGSRAAGGNSTVYSVDTMGSPVETSVANDLTSGVTQIFATVNAFAALKDGGSVITWGGRNSGGSSAGVNFTSGGGVAQIYATDTAFAAVKKDSSVVTWGLNGGTSTGVDFSGGVDRIWATGSAFAALKKDKSVVTWGSPAAGGDSTASAVAAKIRGAAVKTNPVTAVFTTGSAFAAVLQDGAVVSWGNQAAGGDSSGAASELVGVSSFADPFRDDRIGTSPNVAPLITKAVVGAPKVVPALKDATTTVAVSATDVNKDTMTLTATVDPYFGTVKVDPASATAAGTWTVTFTPATDAVRRLAAKLVGGTSTAPVVVTVKDAGGASTNQTVAVTISPLNAAPACAGTCFTNDPTTNDVYKTSGTVTGTITGVTDANKDPLTYGISADGVPKGSSLSGGSVEIKNLNGKITYTYTPTTLARRNAALVDAAAKGYTTDKFTVIVSDGYGGSLPIEVKVPVSPQPNRNPVAGTPSATTSNGVVNGNINATDPDGDKPIYTATTPAAPLKSNKGAEVSVGADGRYTYTATDAMRHEAVRFGGDPSDFFTVVVSDERGGKANIKVPVTIPGKNQAPTGGTFEITGTEAATGVVTGRAYGVTDADNDKVVYTATADRATVIKTTKGATLTVYSDGKFVYTPTAEIRQYAKFSLQYQDDYFTVFATDGYGGSRRIEVKLPISPAFKDNAYIDAQSVSIGSRYFLSAPAAYDGRSVYLDNEQGVFVVDLQTGNGTQLFKDPLGNAGRGETIVSGNRAYVLRWYDNGKSLTVIDTDPSSANYGKPIGDAVVVASASEMRLSPDGSTLFIKTLQGPLGIDIKSTPLKVPLVQNPSSYSWGAYAPRNNREVYVSVGYPDGSTEVWLYDTTSGKTIKKIPTGKSLGFTTLGANMALDLKSSRLYVTTTAGSLLVINTTTNELVTTVPQVGGGKLAVTPDGKRVYVLNGNNLSVIDTDPASVPRNKLIATISENFVNPQAVSISPDGKWVYVTSFTPLGTQGRVSAIAISPNTFEAKPPTAPAPPPNPPAPPSGGDGGGLPPPK